MRPRTLDELVGQDHLTAPGRPLRKLVESDALSTLILWGPPGTGKTTVAEIIASTTKRAFERLSAVSAGVKDIREVIEAAHRRLTIDDRRTVVFIDEIHRFSTAQQDALLHAVESGLIALIGATTENPAFSVNAALRSRATVFKLNPVDSLRIVPLLERALISESATAEPEALQSIARRCNGDVRQALTALEVACALSDNGHVTVAEASAALDTAINRFNTDQHYDMASVFIKSMRASDVDSALHWLARMIASGEDPRFIARRLVIFASEDVGEADPTALLVATAAAQAVQLVGLPEGQLPLAQAVIHLSRAPKSRMVTDSIMAALSDVTEGRTGEVPPVTSSTTNFRPVGMEQLRYYRGNE
jgi:putative ATPase